MKLYMTRLNNRYTTRVRIATLLPFVRYSANFLPDGAGLPFGKV